MKIRPLLRHSREMGKDEIKSRLLPLCAQPAVKKAGVQMSIDHAHRLHEAWQMVEPAKLKPRPFRSLLRASDSAVLEGNCDRVFHRMTIG